MPTLRLDDPAGEWSGVRLDAGPFSAVCRRRAGGWERQIDDRQIWRLEYRFEVTAAGRKRTVYLPDPLAQNQIDSPFGTRSVWQRADYAPPSWLDQPALPGDCETLRLPSALSAPLTVRLWSPDGLRPGDDAPLLWAHDGSDYRDRARLGHWAGVRIGDGSLPPFRIAYADAPRRMQWYSGSDRYLRSVSRGLTALTETYPTTPGIAVIGASLGGLTSMLVAQRDKRVAAVFAQSGSFFTGQPFDKDNQPWRWFTRVSGLVSGLAQRPPRQCPVVGMTCGLAEGNFDNNQAMATTLGDLGLDVRFLGHPDLHNWTNWRDSLEPILPNLLREAWSAVG
ncbi:esterase family protein [Yimella sp. cx-51]|uniref:alpha/beta hydrolase n=1 Tax=Yimella sp. cx-51 TaxID=2770551 RepID=UPI00165DDFAB|nr:alpha/beta hydrolase-fold protein [Yimella sp. cx-51]MBC9957049.1 hypothetical protein [Yimella sp. cx-51]QTH37285.1 hypothetical protein J5M86_10360 [Yimella sp. cx-51]